MQFSRDAQKPNTKLSTTGRSSTDRGVHSDSTGSAHVLSSLQVPALRSVPENHQDKEVSDRIDADTDEPFRSPQVEFGPPEDLHSASPFRPSAGDGILEPEMQHSDVVDADASTHLHDIPAILEESVAAESSPEVAKTATTKKLAITVPALFQSGMEEPIIEELSVKVLSGVEAVNEPPDGESPGSSVGLETDDKKDAEAEPVPTTSQSAHPQENTREETFPNRSDQALATLPDNAQGDMTTQGHVAVKQSTKNRRVTNHQKA